MKDFIIKCLTTVFILLNIHVYSNHGKNSSISSVTTAVEEKDLHAELRCISKVLKVKKPSNNIEVNLSAHHFEKAEDKAAAKRLTDAQNFIKEELENLLEGIYIHNGNTYLPIRHKDYSDDNAINAIIVWTLCDTFYKDKVDQHGLDQAKIDKEFSDNGIIFANLQVQKLSDYIGLLALEAPKYFKMLELIAEKILTTTFHI